MVFFAVFGFDRQFDAAVFAVNRQDDGFYFIAFVQLGGQVFHAVSSKFRCRQVGFHFVCQGNHCAFGFNGFHCAFHQRTFVVYRQEVVEWVAFKLFDAQRNAFFFNINRQHNGFHFFAFFVFANGFFA